MAKKRAVRVPGPGRISASESVRKSRAKSPDSIFHTLQFGDYARLALIFCATLLAYLPALYGSPVWDDSGHLTRPDLQTLHGLWRIWFDLGATQQYYPLLHSAFWLEHWMWGDWVVGYHLTNIVLHALSACLVVLIVKRLSLRGAWLAGLVFALHPVCVESVAWISEQKSTLSGVFCLAALLTYLHFDQDRRKSKYWLATGLFVLALMSKTVTATLPAVLLVIFWWRRGRLEWKRDARPLLPWFAISMSAGLFTAWVERTYIGASGSDFLLTPPQRFLIAGRAICFYFGKLLWPTHLAFFYPQWKVDPSVWWQWLFPAAVLGAVIGLGLVIRRNRGPLASLLIFYGTLFPVLGFLNVYPFRYSYVADHFQYLACLAIIIPGVALLARAIERISSRKAITVACAVLLVLISGVLTWQQSHMYSDLETLYRTSLEHNPGSWMAHFNLGTMLADMPGRLPEAVAEYQAALQIRPEFPDALNNLGIAYSRMPGQLRDAISAYKEALRLRPNHAEAHNNLGKALAQIPGHIQDAMVEYQSAVRIQPDFVEAHYNFGNLLARIPERLPDAITEYKAALRIQPDFVEAHFNLGNALLRTPERAPDAIAEFRAALRNRPNLVEAHLNLAYLLARIPGHTLEAIAEYEQAERLRPDLSKPIDQRIDTLRASLPASDKANAVHKTPPDRKAPV